MGARTRLFQAYLKLHTSVALFGFTGVLGKLIVLRADVLVFWRLVLTVAMFALMARLAGHRFSLPWSSLRRFGLIGLFLVTHWLLFYATVKISVPLALITLSTSAFMTALLEPLLARRRIKTARLIQGAVVCVGIALFASHNEPYGGLLMGLASALTSAIYSVLNKRVVGHTPHVLINFYEMLAALGVMVIWVVAQATLTPGTERLMPTPAEWLYLLALAWGCTNLAYSLSLSALKHISAFTFVLAVNLEPIYGIALAIAILGDSEVLNPVQIMGALLVMLTVFWDPLRIAWRTRQRRRAARQQPQNR